MASAITLECGVAPNELWGAAGESIGLERRMKANTVKTRSYSLFRQGMFYFQWMLTMRDEAAARRLVEKFSELVTQHAVFRKVFGLI